MTNPKDLLFSVTAKDCTFQYYRGSGKGGQKRNKTSNCCRCIHNDSGAVATSEVGRSQLHNKQYAFAKMIETDTFKKWHRIEVSRRTGELALIHEEARKYAEREVKSMQNIKLEVIENGKWKVVKDVSELKTTE